ncbi:hypothetical protein [Paenibacillus sp. MBLB4367]|uniref:hypothetical protein n=1 Tax=Paenibacillus sp. MBLB4367 TaxID=3384767 RepID=UPI003907F56D
MTKILVYDHDFMAAMFDKIEIYQDGELIGSGMLTDYNSEVIRTIDNMMYVRENCEFRA